MAEYIEREKAIKAVADNPYNIAFKTIKTIEEIKRIPTADVVPVVRCRDCKYADLFAGSYICTKSDSPWFNDEFNICMESNDYCSYGERRCSDG